MTVDCYTNLVSYRATDGLELDAAYYSGYPTRCSAAPLLLMTHGAWMNFYTGPQRVLPPLLVPAGFDCLAINSRDRDLAGTNPRSKRMHGMIRARFEDVMLDVGGALQWGRQRGYERFVLLCHSWSAMRGAYYVRESNDSSIVGLAMLSPAPDMCSTPTLWVDDYEAFLERARSLCDAGEGDAILVERPSRSWPIVASANTVLSIWNQPGRLEDLSIAEGLAVPLFLAMDEAETKHAATSANADRIAGVWAGSVTRAVIPHAGHFYLDNPEALAASLLPWLQFLVAPQPL